MWYIVHYIFVHLKLKVNTLYVPVRQVQPTCLRCNYVLNTYNQLADVKFKVTVYRKP